MSNETENTELKIPSKHSLSVKTFEQHTQIMVYQCTSQAVSISTQLIKRWIPLMPGPLHQKLHSRHWTDDEAFTNAIKRALQVSMPGIPLLGALYW